MNILLAYHNAAWQRCGYFHEKYFRAQGVEVTPFALEKSAYWTNFYQLFPFYFPKGKPTSVTDLEKLHQKKFDAVIELDGEGQYHLKNPKKIPAILWTMDTHVAAKRKFQVQFEKEFNSIFSAHKDYCNIFKNISCRWLSFACDPELHKNLQLPKIYEIAFVGKTDPKVYPVRTQLIESLSKKYKVGMFSGIYREEMVKAINQAKIVFNKSLNGDLNMRVFETLGCGSFLLTDKIGNGLSDLFKDGNHLAIYASPKDLEEKASYYLRHDKEREDISQNGQREVLRQHTYHHRAKTILDYLNIK